MPPSLGDASRLIAQWWLETAGDLRHADGVAAGTMAKPLVAAASESEADPNGRGGKADDRCADNTHGPHDSNRADHHRGVATATVSGVSVVAAASGLSLRRHEEYSRNEGGGGNKKRFGFHGILTTRATAVYSDFLRKIFSYLVRSSCSFVVKSG